jgi:hypothetical protein
VNIHLTALGCSSHAFGSNSYSCIRTVGALLQRDGVAIDRSGAPQMRIATKPAAAGDPEGALALSGECARRGSLGRLVLGAGIADGEHDDEQYRDQRSGARELHGCSEYRGSHLNQLPSPSCFRLI